MALVTTDHPQVSLLAPSQETITVDEGMAVLFERVWAAGIDTVFSCQGNAGRRAFCDEGGCAYIMFPSEHDLDRFLDGIGRSVLRHRLTTIETFSMLAWDSDYVPGVHEDDRTHWIVGRDFQNPRTTEEDRSGVCLYVDAEEVPAITAQWAARPTRRRWLRR